MKRNDFDRFAFAWLNEKTSSGEFGATNRSGAGESQGNLRPPFHSVRVQLSPKMLSLGRFCTKIYCHFQLFQDAWTMGLVHQAAGP
jgi:hypothetical protein